MGVHQHYAQPPERGFASPAGLNLVGLALLALTITGILALLIGVLWRPHVFHGMVMQSPEPAANFSLHDTQGRQVQLRDWRGKLVLLFFGYTHCPDVCPTTLAEISQALRLIGPAQADEVQVLMVTVDPERDTPREFEAYVQGFNPDFMGLTGSPEQILAAATSFGVYYQKQPGTAVTGYGVDHTATVIAIDRQGYVRLIFPFGVLPQDMADDLRILLR